MDIKEVIKKCTKYNGGKPSVSFKLVYDAPTSQLEPIYFWLLDFMQERGESVEKVTDNFTASPGSGHFAEMGQRASTMLQQGMNMLGAINQVVKSIIQLLYDLKEYEIRLKHYEDAKSKDKKIMEAGMLAVKQIWMDNVDMKKGRGSINQMSFELGFTTLRDAFMICNSVEDVNKMADSKDGTINDQVKRILIPRISEFLKWKELSEKELSKRFEIEKSYLRSQVETLKLYTSWARPYLKAAEELKQKGFENKDYLVNPKNPALVNMFNTAMFELVLLGKTEVSVSKLISGGKLPKSFDNYKMKRRYYAINLVSFIFRGIPQKVTQQNYGFGGRVEVTFDSYVLNSDELSLMKKELSAEDVKDAFGFAYKGTEESLVQMKEDIEHFLDDKKDKKKEEEKKRDEGNPFAAIVDLFREGFKSTNKKEEQKVINKIGEIKSDDYVEKTIRKLAEKSAMTNLYTIYDVYKKAHGHPSSPESFDTKFV